LQDTGRAIVVGDTQSHGKGTVQTVYPMGSEVFGSMKVTTARFYRINGSSTQVKGVAADIVLPSTLDGLDTGEDKLPNALPWTRVEPVGYSAVWNMNEYVQELKALSDARLAGNMEWQRHMRAVKLFRESSERKTAPLERKARMKLMREEREMRELDDAKAEDDDESPEETAFAQSEEGKERNKDVVLDEAFKVLADLVRLTGGKEAPPPPEVRVPAWLRALGGG
jgi:carboxyl-terminal processing protease